MIDGIRERGRYYDIIIEALLDYDEWMKDDDYNSTTALNKIMKRMRERLEMSDPPPRLEVQTAEPITHRWRSFGAHTWIYDPEPEWLEDHKFEIEWEPVYGTPQPAPEIQNVGNGPAISDVRWAVNVLLEKIAEGFEQWDTHDIWRSDAASYVRAKKHDLSGGVAQASGMREALEAALAFIDTALVADENPTMSKRAVMKTIRESLAQAVPYPSTEAMKLAVELEILSALGRVHTVKIGRLIQKIIDASPVPSATLGSAAK